MLDGSFRKMMIPTFENLVKDCSLKIGIYSWVCNALFSQQNEGTKKRKKNIGKAIGDTFPMMHLGQTYNIHAATGELTLVVRQQYFAVFCKTIL